MLTFSEKWKIFQESWAILSEINSNHSDWGFGGGEPSWVERTFSNETKIEKTIIVHKLRGWGKTARSWQTLENIWEKNIQHYLTDFYSVRRRIESNQKSLWKISKERFNPINALSLNCLELNENPMLISYYYTRSAVGAHLTLIKLFRRKFTYI